MNLAPCCLKKMATESIWKGRPTLPILTYTSSQKLQACSKLACFDASHCINRISMGQRPNTDWQSLENIFAAIHGKSMGNPWEIHGKSIGNPSMPSPKNLPVPCPWPQKEPRYVSPPEEPSAPRVRRDRWPSRAACTRPDRRTCQTLLLV